MNDDLKIDEERARFLAALAEYEGEESDLAGWFGGGKSKASQASDGKFYLVEGQTYTSGDDQYTPQADKSILYVNSKTKESLTLTPGTEYYNNALKLFNAAGVKTKRDWQQIAGVAGGFLNQFLGIQPPAGLAPTTTGGQGLQKKDESWSPVTWALVIGGSLAVVAGGYFAYRSFASKKK
jgi:hypothetical protein